MVFAREIRRPVIQALMQGGWTHSSTLYICLFYVYSKLDCYFMEALQQLEATEGATHGQRGRKIMWERPSVTVEDFAHCERCSRTLVDGMAPWKLVV